MSDLSNEAGMLLGAGDLVSAAALASKAVRTYPDDFHGYYVLGQCLRFQNAFAAASGALAHAYELAPSQPEILLALGIVQQLDRRLPAAIATFAKALAIDPDYAAAYNSLAMTQKITGEYIESAENYDLGAKALSRSIIKSLVNAETNRRVRRVESRNNLWLSYAVEAAVLFSASNAKIDSVAWPTGEMAERDARTGYLRGWFWRDQSSTDGKTVRLFLPNFLNTLASALRGSGVYAELMGNRSTVLELLGKRDEARQHLEEAQDFVA